MTFRNWGYDSVAEDKALCSTTSGKEGIVKEEKETKGREADTQEGRERRKNKKEGERQGFLLN